MDIVIAAPPGLQHVLRTRVIAQEIGPCEATILCPTSRGKSLWDPGLLGSALVMATCLLEDYNYWFFSSTLLCYPAKEGPSFSWEWPLLTCGFWWSCKSQYVVSPGLSTLNQDRDSVLWPVPRLCVWLGQLYVSCHLPWLQEKLNRRKK